MPSASLNIGNVEGHCVSQIRVDELVFNAKHATSPVSQLNISIGLVRIGTSSVHAKYKYYKFSYKF